MPAADLMDTKSTSLINFHGMSEMTDTSCSERVICVGIHFNQSITGTSCVR